MSRAGAGIVCVHNSASAQPRASAPAACAAWRAWHAPSCGDTAQCGGSGLTGRLPRRGDGPTPSPLHAPRRASAAPTGHLQRALPSDHPPDADGCRVARCSPAVNHPPDAEPVAQLSSSHTRRRARRSSVSTRSRAIGSDQTGCGSARRGRQRRYAPTPLCPPRPRLGRRRGTDRGGTRRGGLPSPARRTSPVTDRSRRQPTGRAPARLRSRVTTRRRWPARSGAGRRCARRCGWRDRAPR